MDADWVRLIEDRIEAAEKRLDAARADIDKLKAMANWVVGAAAMLGLLLGAGGHTVLEKLLR